MLTENQLEMLGNQIAASYQSGGYEASTGR